MRGTLQLKHSFWNGWQLQTFYIRRILIHYLVRRIFVEVCRLVWDPTSFPTLTHGIGVFTILIKTLILSYLWFPLAYFLHECSFSLDLLHLDCFFYLVRLSKFDILSIYPRLNLFNMLIAFFVKKIINWLQVDICLSEITHWSD